MALLSDRTGRVVATEDENGDGRVTDRDDTIAAARVADGDEAVTVPPVSGRAQVDERVASQHRLAERTAAAQAATLPRPVAVDSSVLTSSLPPVGPRARVSMLATVALVFGLTSLLTVLTGVLAGPGVALGLVAAFLGVGGISATSRRHVAGKGLGLFAVALGLAAIVIGTLALTGTLSWLDGGTNQVTHAHDWLAARVSWLFPTR